MSRQNHSPIASEMSGGQKFFWARPTRQVVDIFRKPVDNFDRLSEAAKTRNRQTQTTLADPAFRVLGQENAWSLIELADGTFGWLPNSNLKRARNLDYWAKIKAAPREKLVEIKAPGKAKVHKILAEFAGIPYLWGGTTQSGMDCSAFSQRLFWQLGKILLPRNSREQKKCGRSVQSTKIKDLDLLFFVRSTTGRHHVAVYWDGEVWHFCLDKQGLTSESLESIKKRYNHLATRRIFKFKHA